MPNEHIGHLRLGISVHIGHLCAHRHLWYLASYIFMALHSQVCITERMLTSHQSMHGLQPAGTCTLAQSTSFRHVTLGTYTPPASSFGTLVLTPTLTCILTPTSPYSCAYVYCYTYMYCYRYGHINNYATGVRRIPPISHPSFSPQFLTPVSHPSFKVQFPTPVSHPNFSECVQEWLDTASDVD